MRLAFDRLKACAHGCASVREEDQGAYFDRMPDALRKHYAAENKLFLRCRCNAGVRLRFGSNTGAIRLALRFGRDARPIRVVDLYVDGTLRGVHGPAEVVAEWSGKVFAAPKREVRAFDLWMPYSIETWVAAVELDDGASFEPLPHTQPKWLAIGDSITQGMTVSNPSRTYAAQTAMLLDVELHNVGIGSAQMEPEVGAACDEVDWSLATVSFGVNDWHKEQQTLDDFAGRTRGLLKGLLCNKPGRPVGLMTPLPYAPFSGPNARGDTLAQYRQVLVGVAEEFESVTLIDGPSLMSADPALCTDSCHPNEQGMSKVARNLATRLSAVCPRP